MRKTVFIAFIAAVALGMIAAVVWAQPVGQVGNIGHPTSEKLSAQASRACVFASGGWTIVDCSNVAAVSSAALSPWSRYVIQCTDDSYFAVGTAATGQMADANDGRLLDGAMFEMLTSNTILYYSCLNINADADCRHIKCL